MPYRIEYSDRARSDLRRVPGNYRQRAKRLIASLADNPRPPKAKELRDNPNGYRLWLDRWRVIYRVDDDLQVVFIAGVRPKKGPETYEDLQWS